MEKKLLHVHDLAIGYQGKTLLDHFSMDVQCGELIGLKGRNGRGKTTLLKTLCGLLQPLHGDVFFSGKNIHLMSPHERAKCISIVLTDRIKLQGITVRGLVEMGRYPCSGSLFFKNEIDKEIIDQSLEKLSIAHLAEKSLAAISDGELQKAMIARSLAQQTPLILMDEPSAFLDYIAKEEFFQLMRRLATEEQIGFIYSSHDIGMMEKFSSTIVEL